MLLWVCSVIDPRRRQNVVRTSATIVFVLSTFWRQLCQLLLNGRTVKWNLPVKKSFCHIILECHTTENELNDFLHLAELKQKNYQMAAMEIDEPLNPLHCSISMHVLLTVLYTLPMVLMRRICWTIKSFFSWWSTS